MQKFRLNPLFSPYMTDDIVEPEPNLLNLSFSTLLDVSMTSVLIKVTDI